MLTERKQRRSECENTMRNQLKDSIDNLPSVLLKGL